MVWMKTPLWKSDLMNTNWSQRSQTFMVNTLQIKKEEMITSTLQKKKLKKKGNLTFCKIILYGNKFLGQF